jgi:Family of unknown function (DUF6328)
MSDSLMTVTTHQVPVRRLRHHPVAEQVEESTPVVPRAHTVRRPSRAYAEILQEIRIAQTGAQVLLGFLLSLGFTERFSTLARSQQSLYVVVLALAVAATALLVAPTAFRQLNFRRQMDHLANTTANRFVLCGLGLMMCAIIGSLLFALSAVLGFRLASVVAVGALVWFVAWWYVFPLWSRTRHAPIVDRPAEPKHRLSVSA